MVAGFKDMYLKKELDDSSIAFCDLTWKSHSVISALFYQLRYKVLSGSKTPLLDGEVASGEET